jgi:hypothetical protein
VPLHQGTYFEKVKHNLIPNEKKIRISGVILLIFIIHSCKKDKPLPVGYTGQTCIVNDIYGNSYPTIGIGSQIWMAENLKTIKYNDGTSIPLVTNEPG